MFGRMESYGLFLGLILITMLAVCDLCPAQDGDCSSARNKWDLVFQDLRSKMQDFSTIQQTPVDRLIQRPIVDRADGKSIAKQVSEAIQAKEDLLNARRKDCRNLLNIENQSFTEYQDCANSAKVKDKEWKNTAKKRQGLLEKAVVVLSEVREVEGRETAMPYIDAMQEPQARSVNNYWQNYQQMYKRWWNH